MSQPKIIFILGPTASGKSTRALELALKTGAEIINADSKQLYGALPLLAAFPSPEDRAKAPHHLYGILQPSESMSVVTWCHLATQTIRAIHARGRDAILVGGTGFYFKTLSEGIHYLPAVSDLTQQEAAWRLEKEGAPAIHQWLNDKDPTYPLKCRPQDTHRVLRALAIYLETGLSIAHHLAGERVRFLEEAPEWIIVDHPRPLLRARILARAYGMMALGALEEVKALWPPSPYWAPSFTTTIGFQEWNAFLHHQFSYKEAFTRMVDQTCQYAKRQQTWLRHQLP